MSELDQLDHKAALEQYRKIPSATRRGRAASNMSKQVALADPDLAVTWLENEVSGYYQTHAAAEAANELAEKEPTLGANFAIRFNNPRLLKRTVHEALKVFANEDPEGMQSWANTVTDPTAREAVQAEIERLSQ